jgi:hypothetical protein
LKGKKRKEEGYAQTIIFGENSLSTFCVYYSSSPLNKRFKITKNVNKKTFYNIPSLRFVHVGVKP